MKNHVPKMILALTFFTSVLGFSQSNMQMPCGTYEAMEQHFASHPQDRMRYENAQKELLQSVTINASAKPAAFEYTVPVVFHVLHQGGPENVSDAVIMAALDQVNRDFSRAGSDTGAIFAPFRSRYVNSEIKFVLAKRDPQGNCTNGIVRYIDPKTNWSQSGGNQNFYWTYTWNSTRYLNVYIVGSITPAGTVTGGGIIVGYTYMPGTHAAGSPRDAIVYRSSHLSANMPNPDARSLSHEIGHWLGLSHTFGPTNNPGINCGDDGIADTPPTKGNFSSCPASSSNTNHTCSSPNPSNVNNYFQNVENIMDYSSCPRNFTQGQTTVMRNILASAIANRQNLSSVGNLTLTGINVTTPCAPKAEFLSTNGSYTVCAGGSLTMKDFSYNGVISNYIWNADNGSVINAPNAVQTSITFPNVGAVSVSLTVSNSQGASVKTRNVVVLDATPSLVGPFFESFENPGVPYNWSVIDVQNDGFSWLQTGQTAYHDNYCFYIDGLTHAPSASDILQMPLLDVKNNMTNKLSFAYAYRRKNSTHDDVLRVQGSRDCGGTWNDIVVLSASAMAQGSGGVDTEMFFPNSDQWKTYVLSDHPMWLNYINSSSVLVRFNFIEASAGYGNNFFIDLIDFTAPVGINELTKSFGLSLYPNPSSSETTLRFNLQTTSAVKISLLDVLGKEVKIIANQTLAAGEQNFSVNSDEALSKGIYFVNLNVNGAIMSQKLVIK